MERSTQTEHVNKHLAGVSLSTMLRQMHEQLDMAIDTSANDLIGQEIVRIRGMVAQLRLNLCDLDALDAVNAGQPDFQ